MKKYLKAYICKKKWVILALNNPPSVDMPKIHVHNQEA